jgi:hypothetical protein
MQGVVMQEFFRRLFWQGQIKKNNQDQKAAVRIKANRITRPAQQQQQIMSQSQEGIGSQPVGFFLFLKPAARRMKRPPCC